MINKQVIVIGAGLAGCEAAWQIANSGIQVKLVEMRPFNSTPAHHTSEFAELVCSNSFGALSADRAAGLLQEELRTFNSLIIQTADKFSVPAGGALAVDRSKFSKSLTQILSSHPLVEISRDNFVERFIYASSSSVYGVKEEPNVHEEMSLEPLTDYSIFKADCEKILLEYQSKDFTTITIRPATVCGYSPRQRLDVVVNILTNLAFHKREITIFGGSQLRPNIHIKDMAEAYLSLINAPKEKVAGEIFNAGYENHSVRQIGEMVKEAIGQDVVLKTVPTDDNRSYHVSSEKIKKVLGFTATNTIRDACLDLKYAFETGLLPNSLEDELYFNIKRMQSLDMK